MYMHEYNYARHQVVAMVLRHTLPGYSVRWLNLWPNLFVAYNNSEEISKPDKYMYIDTRMAKIILGHFKRHWQRNEKCI